MNRPPLGAEPTKKNAHDLMTGDRPVLVAVSGGSDSVALLHWMVEQFADANLHCVTVDHGLRTESADEARQVGGMASELGVAHKTLNWQPNAPASSAESRQARYRLLHQYATVMNAACVVLGHNLDDQAETIFMRALRSRPDSDTRGLSGIAEWSTYHGLPLWRPLLAQTRQQLRDGLSQNCIDWIDDPSNQDSNYERVRVRRILSNSNVLKLPSRENLARLATLSGRSRSWMSAQVARIIRQNVLLTKDLSLRFDPDPGLPKTILQEVLACLILVAGGLSHRVPTAKLSQIAATAKSKTPMQITLGRCLISARQGAFTIQREKRNLAEMPKRIQTETVFDGRWLLKPKSGQDSMHKTPYIEALETFRPRFDDPVHAAVMDLLDSPCCST